MEILSSGEVWSQFSLGVLRETLRDPALDVLVWACCPTLLFRTVAIYETVAWNLYAAQRWHMNIWLVVNCKKTFPEFIVLHKSIYEIAICVNIVDGNQTFHFPLCSVDICKQFLIECMGWIEVSIKSLTQVMTTLIIHVSEVDQKQREFISNILS